MITFITAGGGLVQNSFGEYLLIFRNGKWDLPKGKQDKDESLIQTALREVAEECGLDVIVPGPFIAHTWHSYYVRANDYSPLQQIVFKKTHWFYMYVDGQPTTYPQTEEGIELCSWYTPEEATQCLKESYPSIRWLFQCATGIKING